jgi:hypothetical protein
MRKLIVCLVLLSFVALGYSNTDNPFVKVKEYAIKGPLSLEGVHIWSKNLEVTDDSGRTLITKWIMAYDPQADVATVVMYCIKTKEAIAFVSIGTKIVRQTYLSEDEAIGVAYTFLRDLVKNGLI